MQTIGILNGENINYDHQFAALIKGIASAGIVSGFEIQNGDLLPGVCTIDCVRANGQQLRVVFESDETIDISSLADLTKIFVLVNQSKINDGSQNEADGTGIGKIVFDSVYPSPAINYLPLAEIIDNEPVMVGKMVEIKDSALENSPIISNMKQEINNVEQTINIFETDGLPTSHLTEKHYCAEVITPGVNVGFLQQQPDEENCLEAHNIGDVASNTKKAQRCYLNGEELTYIDLILEMAGSSTQDVVVRIEHVDADGKPTGELIDPNAQTTISFGNIGAKSKVRANFSGITEKTAGLACATVCNIPIINASNYYKRYADVTQYSDGMGNSGYNGTQWNNGQAMMGCWSDGFAQGMVCKATTTKVGNKIKIGPKLLYPNYENADIYISNLEFISFGRINLKYDRYFGLKNDIIIPFSGNTLPNADICLGGGDMFGIDKGMLCYGSNNIVYEDNSNINQNVNMDWTTKKSYTMSVNTYATITYNSTGNQYASYGARILINGIIVNGSEIPRQTTKEITIKLYKGDNIALQLYKGNGDSGSSNINNLFKVGYTIGVFNSTLEKWLLGLPPFS